MAFVRNDYDIGNATQILNQFAGEYIKNLSSDNRLMGEVFFKAMLNETIENKTNVK